MFYSALTVAVSYTKQIIALGFPSLQIYRVRLGKIQTLCNLCRAKLKQASTRSLIPLQCLTLQQHQRSEDGLANKWWQCQSIQQLPLQRLRIVNSLSTCSDDNDTQPQIDDNYKGCVHYKQSSWQAGFNLWVLGVCGRFLCSLQAF